MQYGLATLTGRAILLSAMMTTPLLTSCHVFAGLTPGLRIFDYETAKIVNTLQPGEYREMVCEEVILSKSFFTITREKESLVIRKRDEDGIQRDRHELPLLNSVWHEPHWLAISPSGNQIAYWDDDTRSLRVRSLAGGQERIIFRGGKGMANELDLIAWKDSENIVIVSDPEVASYDFRDIYRISLDGSVRHVRTQFGLYPRISLSPNKRLVGGVISVTHKPNPDWKKGDQLMVLDLNSMSEHSRVPQIAPRQRIGEIEWTDDSKSIVFPLQISGEESEVFYRFDLVARSSEKIKPPMESGSMSVVGSRNGLLLISDAGKLKWYNYRTRTWKACTRPTGRIAGWIPETSRWIITDF